MDDPYQWRPEDDSSSDSAPLNTSLPRLATTDSSSTERRSQGDSFRASRRLYEERELKLQLLTTKKQLKLQELRTAEAERELFQLAKHLKRVNDARLVAQQQAAKASEELKLYKTQLQHAQQEIFRAQAVLDDVDRQRYKAEKEASQAKTLARRLNRDLVIKAAMEEGRRIGLQEGLERARTLALQDIAEFDGEDEYYDENDELDVVDRRPRSLLIGSSEDMQQSSRSSPPEPPVPAPAPPVPPPEVAQADPNNRPRSFRNSPSPVHHARVSIPPDGYIPQLDADHFIRIPPPYELSRPPPTPERVVSPPLPQIPQEEEPLPIPHRSHRGHQYNSSLGSSASSLSHLDLVNATGYTSGRQSPLSVIPEVRSLSSSPNPQSVGGHDLKHQSSWGGSSRHANGMGPGQTPHIRAASITTEQGISQQAQSHHRRLSTSSNASRASRPPPNSQEARRKSSSSASTVPPISVLPPSGPASPQATPQNQYTTLESHTASPKPSPILFQPVDNQQLPPGFVPYGGNYSPNSGQSALPTLVPMPGAYQGQGYQTPQSLAGGRRDTAANEQYSDDEAASSAMSNDTLTTPPLGRQTRHRRIPSVDALMTPPPREGRQESGWESALRLAGSPVPIPFDNRPPRGSRPLSRSTNRS
ncbi:hypothetical protein D9615_002335 [Tricholomella constricta]|uniref:Uncharacterized protein n=1 Tax=Tricholomella constricta TaxID=117010 RepID=A0A8H5HLZ5_9AGAR|nr:hypothetical protein D9615_002335 [Tricholomella constricta]